MMEYQELANGKAPQGVQTIRWEYMPATDAYVPHAFGVLQRKEHFDE